MSKNRAQFVSIIPIYPLLLWLSLLKTIRNQEGHFGKYICKVKADLFLNQLNKQAAVFKGVPTQRRSQRHWERTNCSGRKYLLQQKPRYLHTNS